MNLSQWLQEQQLSEELQQVMLSIANIGKKVRKHIQLYNKEQATTENASGDVQMALDKQADNIFFDTLQQLNNINNYASEEREKIETINSNAAFSVALDPLDGSSLIDVNFAIGSIVGFHEGTITTDKRNITAALYILYGPLTTLIISPGKGKGTHEFMATETGYELVEKNIMCKEKGKIYSPGGKRGSWTQKHTQFITKLEAEGYGLRYSGCFVAEVNQILLKKGGLFAYPKTTEAPQGKLRVLYELEPLTFILEEAGGLGIDGKDSFINLPILSVHQKAAAYFGSKYEIKLATQILNN